MAAKKDASEIQSEFEKWRNFFNNIVGMLFFLFGLGCLGTNNPMLYAWISLFFVMLFMFTGAGLYLSNDSKKRSLSETETELLEDVEKSLLNIPAFTEQPVYWFGFFFLLGVGLNIFR